MESLGKMLGSPLETVKDIMKSLQTLGTGGIVAALLGLLMLVIIGIVPSTLTKVDAKIDSHIKKQVKHNDEMQKFREQSAIQSELIGQQCVLSAKQAKDTAAEVNCGALIRRSRSIGSKIDPADEEPTDHP